MRNLSVAAGALLCVALLQAQPTVHVSHGTSYFRAQTNAVALVRVTSTGAGAFNLAITPDPNFTVTAINANANWTCNLVSLACSRPTSSGAIFEFIQLVGTVNASAPATITNQATLTGTGLSTPLGATDSVPVYAPSKVIQWGANNLGSFTNLPSAPGLIALAAGLDHEIALASDGSIVQWGNTTNSQNSNLPTTNGFLAIAAGSYHNIALTGDGHLVMWGGNTIGQQTGLPTTAGFIAVATTAYYTMALTNDGHIVMWGSHTNTTGIPTTGGYVAISGGYDHSIALTADGHISQWGATNLSQNSGLPTDGGYIAISAGEYSCMAQRADGTIVQWGSNSNGALVGAPTTAVQSASSTSQNYASWAMASDGSLVQWGDVNGSTGGKPTYGGFVYNSPVIGGLISAALLPLANPTLNGGGGQSANVNAAFATPLSVKVLDVAGNPAQGVNIVFTAPGSGASGKFSNNSTTITVATDSTGVASTTFTANGTGGQYSVTASYLGLQAVSIPLTNIALAATTMNKSAGDNQSAPLGQPFPVNLKVTVLDQNGNPFAGAPVTFTVFGGIATGAFASTPTQPILTGTDGTATAPVLVSSGSPGSITVQANTGSLYQYFIVGSTVPSTLNKSAGDAQSGTVGTPFATNLKVTALNSLGNPFAAAQVTFTVVPGLSGGTGTFASTPAQPILTGADGTATAPALTPTVGGPFTVIASVAGSSLTQTFSMSSCSGSAVTVTSNADSGAGSLRNAVANICSGGTITFDPAAFATPQTITLASRILLNQSVTITGNGKVTISGNNATRIFFVGSGTTAPFSGTVAINGLTLANGYGQGGASRFGGGAAGMGGAIFQNGGTLTLTNVKFQSNQAVGGANSVSGSSGSGGGFGGDGNAFNGGSGGDLGGSGGGEGTNGGNGGDGGGGGWGTSGNGGNGGFGGGGGFGRNIFGSTVAGGNGGFGAGGGASESSSATTSVQGTPGWGAGDAAGFNGGAGGAFGGAIFVRSGTLNLSGVNFTGNSATGGGSGAQAKGGSLFVYFGASATAIGSTFSNSTAANAGQPGTGGSPAPYTTGATCPGVDNVDVCGVLIQSPTVTAILDGGNNVYAAGTLYNAGSGYNNVNFSEPVTNATDPGNYLVVSRADGQDPQTTSCASIASGDTSVGIGQISYSSNPVYATVHFTFVANTRYKMLACAANLTNPANTIRSQASNLALASDFVSLPVGALPILSVSGVTQNSAAGAGIAENAVVVPGPTALYANLNEAPGSSTVSSATVKLFSGTLSNASCSSAGTLVPGSVSVNGSAIVFTPSSALASGSYHYVLCGTIKGGNGAYLGASSGTTAGVDFVLDFSVQASNVITFPQPADTALTSSPVTLTATATSGLAVSYGSNSTTICTVSGSSVTLLNVGLCSITASQAGNGSFAAATPVTKTFNVTQGVNTINFTQPVDTALSVGTLTLTATASSGLAVSFGSNSLAICTVAGSTVTFVTPGVCSITASQVGNTNYVAATPVTKTFNITQNSNVITFPQPADTALTSSPVTLTATATSGLAVSYGSNSTTICTVAGSSVTLKSIGLCSITASQAGNGTFAAATPVTKTFNVTQGVNTINFTQPADTAFSVGSLALTATASSGLAVSFGSNSLAICTVAGSTVTFVTPGVCSITASQAGNANYVAATPVTKTFNITQNSNVITFPQPADTALTSSPVTLTATATSGLAVSYGSNSTTICTVAGSSVTLKSIGLCSITASQAGNGTFAAATPVTRTFNVTQGVNTINFTQPADTALSVGTLALTATASSGLAVSFGSNSLAICTVAGSTVTFATAGQCSITASQVGNTNYAAATPVTKTFNITQNSNVITFPQPSDTALTSSPVTLTATATSGLAVSYGSNSTTICTVSGSTVTLLNVGLCSITASQAGNGTFAAATPVTKTFNVTQGVNTINFTQPADTAFSVGSLALTATASSGLAVGFGSNSLSICTVAGSTVTFVTAGQCSITASQVGNTNYAAATPVTKTFNITQNSNVITFPQPSDTALTSSPVTLTATATSGLAVSYGSNSTTICTVSGSTVTLLNVGVCSITASQAGNGTFAAATPVTKTFNVTQGVNTINFTQPTDTAFTVGSLALTATASSGLAVSFGSNSLSICTVAGSTVTFVTAGQCSITASQVGNSNYAAATPVTKTFNITQNSNVITFPQPADTSMTSGPVTLTATATSGLAVSYASNSTAVCTVAGSSLTLKNVGLCSITANQAGNGTFAAATPVTRTFNVTQGTPVIAWATPADIIYGGALGSGQLNATANLPGTFTYTPAAGVVLPVGDGQRLSVTFTPADSVNYQSGSASVLINVKPIPANTGANLIVTPVLRRDSATGNIVMTLTVANNGSGTATNVQLNQATLAAMAPMTTLPVIIGNIAGGGQAQVTLTFPSTVGASGARAVLGLSGAYVGGSFGGNTRVTLP